MKSKPNRNIENLIEIMALLRHPTKGCPWDVEQTFETIASNTIEEAYEVVEAIEQKDMLALVDELGDLLLQVIFHARIAEENSLFSFSLVIRVRLLSNTFFLIYPLLVNCFNTISASFFLLVIFSLGRSSVV